MSVINVFLYLIIVSRYFLDGIIDRIEGVFIAPPPVFNEELAAIVVEFDLGFCIGPSGSIA